MEEKKEKHTWKMNNYNSSCCFFLPLWLWLEILMCRKGRLSWKGSSNSSRSLPRSHFSCFVFLYLQTKYDALIWMKKDDGFVDLFIRVTLLRSNVVFVFEFSYEWDYSFLVALVLLWFMWASQAIYSFLVALGVLVMFYGLQIVSKSWYNFFYK